MELAGYLNDSGLLLQAVVQCYGLLAPLLHFKLPSLPVIQVLSRNIIVLDAKAISPIQHGVSVFCLFVVSSASWGKQESPANAKGTRDSSACMKAHCEQM